MYDFDLVLVSRCKFKFIYLFFVGAVLDFNRACFSRRVGRFVSLLGAKNPRLSNFVAAIILVYVVSLPSFTLQSLWIP